jgi:hypothetical protein
MKIAQFHEASRIRLGLIQTNSLIPIDFGGEMIEFIKSDRVMNLEDSKVIDLDRVRLATPVSPLSKGIGIGLKEGDEVAVEIERVGRLVNSYRIR